MKKDEIEVIKFLTFTGFFLFFVFIICGLATEEFLNYAKEIGNGAEAPFHVVKNFKE